MPGDEAGVRNNSKLLQGRSRMNAYLLFAPSLLDREQE
jgi:hypothetical protein